ncbi:Tetraspanin-33 [Willisornis vidua]|uniref:Tetraspanin-33 n=1 Tax=Willisornis vidua TaxID=1566151 RepID=A0ABQ9DN00_9PASS|nr:Tetraspanin-33 [Willisornis vidua]
MARRAAVSTGPVGDDFSFVSPVVKYVLFFFNLLFWMISMVMVAVGVYARMLKHTEAAVACLAVDPAILLIVVGVLTFLITFCGCIGSLRENICLLQTFSVCLTIIFLLQLAAGVLGFVFSDKARGKVSEIINGAIVHYRDDLDLQNLIDFGQKETVVNTMCGHEMQNMGYLEASAFIYTNGCIDKLVNWIHSNLFLLGGITLGLALPQLVVIVLAQLLINQIRDQIKLQLYNQQHRADPWY